MNPPPKKRATFVPIHDDTKMPWGTMRWSVTGRVYTALLKSGEASPPFKNRKELYTWLQDKGIDTSGLMGAPRSA